MTLRGLVVTPDTNVQVLAAREQSIEAFRTAMLSEQPDIAVFCQLNDDEETPGRDGLLPVGVICRVISGVYKDTDNFKCLLRGTGRIRLINVLDEDGCAYRKATFEMLQETTHSQSVLDHYVTVLQAALDHALKNGDPAVKSFIDKTIPSDLIETLKKHTDLSVITNVLAQTASIGLAEKRYLLSCLDPVERARFLIVKLNGFSYQAELERRIVEEARLSMDRNQKEYFLNEQLKYIKRELHLDKGDDDEAEILMERLEELKAPPAVKKRIEKEIKKYSTMSYHNSESVTSRNYIETLMSIPWQESSEVNKDLSVAKEVLDHDHYGLEKVKERILEYLAVQSRSDKIHGPILCLMGPPGIGKTSLGASIAKATGRKYARAALGGIHDESEIRGHRRTYVGSLPGKIISNIIGCGVNNPLFLLDEIDKLGHSVHGDPEAALLEVLDPEQNHAFTDNYVEIEYDLSNVLFIATANSYNISQPLLDRMEIIDLSSYTEEEKFNIAKRYLLPKQIRLNTLDESYFCVTDEAILELIRYYTHEAGVRGLERLLNKLCRVTVKDMLLKESAKADRGDGKKRPRRRKIVIDEKKLPKILGPRRYDFTSKLSENKIGLVNGLAWTSMGGELLQLEAVANSGKGNHTLTGKLGDVMKESISAAMTLVRSRAHLLKLDPQFFEKCDLHIHVPEGATPKEGPSAGVGMVTAIVSALTYNPVRADVAMTGEITLRGDVLPIGGLKEKLLAALRGGIKLVLIPEDNKKDLWDMPKSVLKGLKIEPVGRIDEVLKFALQEDPYEHEPQSPWKINHSLGSEEEPSETKVHA